MPLEPTLEHEHSNQQKQETFFTRQVGENQIHHPYLWLSNDIIKSLSLECYVQIVPLQWAGACLTSGVSISQLWLVFFAVITSQA